MKSYTQGIAQYGVWTKNTNTANNTQGALVANDDYRTICAMKDWPFLTRLRTLTTVANQQNYNYPYDCDMVREIAVIVSNIRYTPRPSPSQEHWDKLNLVTFTSDIPQWWFTLNGQILLWPKPASSGNTINVTQKCRVIDLGAADYITGNITTVATSGVLTTVTGSGTAWTSQMVGRFIQIAYAGASDVGDGIWYEIAGVASATSLTLVRTYGGTAIAAASANYIISQMPLLPENFHDLPWLAAAGNYWMKESDKRAASFFSIHGQFPSPGKAPTGKLKVLEDNYSSPTGSFVIDDGGGDEIVNPNLTISL